MAKQSTETKTDPYLVGMVALQLCIAAVIGVIVWMITGWWFSICALIGLALWSTLLLSTDLVQSFFVEIAEFSGAVFVNQFKSDLMPDNDKDAIKSLSIPSDSIREVGAGYHGKWPWERVDAVDLRRHIVIGKPIKAYTKDNIEVMVDWVDTLTPLKGYLVNYRRWSEEARKAFFEGAFQENILAIIKTLDEKDLFGEIGYKGIESIKNKFSQRFGGENEVNPDEAKFGTFTNNPTIKSIERSEKYRKAAESVKIAEQTNAAIGSFDSTIDRRLAAAAVLGSQDIDTVKTFQFVGKIEGLENAHTVIIGGAGDVFDKDKQGKGK